MKKDWFDIAYNKWLKSQASKEDDALWDNIQDELDFENTWDNISTKLDQKDRRKRILIPFKYALFTALAVGLFGATFSIFNSKSDDIVASIPKDTLSTEKDNPKEPKATDLSVLELENPKVKTISKGTKEGKIKSDFLETPLIQKQVENLVNQKPYVGFNRLLNNTKVDETYDETAYNKLEKQTADNTVDLSSPTINSPDTNAEMAEVFPENTDSSLEKHQITQLLLPDTNLAFSNKDTFLSDSTLELPNLRDKTKKSFFKVIDAGLVFGFKNTWLLNNETRNGLNPNKLNNTLLTFHHDIGIASTFEIYNRHQFALEFFWKSETGQNYQEYINASFTDRNLKLEYLNFQLLYFLNSDKIPGQGILGAYFAKLALAEEQIGASNYDLSDYYNNFDYGIVAGYQFNIFLTKKIILKPSFRMSYNLMNIFSGNELTPKYLNQTNNLSNSLNISLLYRFN